MISLLYVDDEPELLDLGKLFLERGGEFSVITAESVHEGLGRLGSESFDAIISDYQMPVVDGIEFLKRVRSEFSDIPFILFTGRGREEVVIQAINHGVDFYLQKGGDPSAQFAELAHKIKRAVERRRAFDALIDSEQRLSDIINFLPDATFAINGEGIVIAWNKAIEEMSGVPAKEMMGKGDYAYSLAFYDKPRPLLIDLIFESHEKIQELGYTIDKKEGDVLIAETTLAQPRGKSGVFLAKASLLYDKNGQIAGAIESVRDITDIKTVVETLNKREAELKSIFRAAPAGIGVIDEHRIIREVNDYVCLMTGYSKMELIGRSTRVIFATEQDYLYVGKEGYAQIKDHGSGSVETRWKKKDGTIIDVLLSSAPFDPADMTQGITFTAFDITSRKLIETDLRAAYEKNQGLMDSANDAIFIVGVNTGMLLDANKKALEMIGRTREEIPGLHQSDLHPEREKNHFRQLFQKRAADGAGTDEEIIVNREGHEFPVIVSATMLNLGGMPCMMEIIHDISDIKKAQDALRLANKKLNLLAEITRHDIRNKLTVLGGYLHLFKDHPPEPQYSMYLAKLEETIVTVSNNIEFTRLYQDLGVVAPAWQNAHMTFFSACTHIDMKKVRILSDLGGLEIYADPLLERVFFNLADNAVQYGNRITTIRLSAEESAGGLIIRVQDDGVGIPPNDKEKIFTKGYGRNTGLGLFLAREILSITGITIRETGEYQHGALFELHVPPGMYRRSRI